MTTKDKILEIIQTETQKKGHEPIFEIMLMSKPGTKSEIYPSGKDSGFPDTGTTDTPGFYHDIDDAIHTMHTNNADIREYTFCAGFILCRFPGVYQPVGTDLRMYFIWDEEKQGFFEAEEPILFRNIAY